ncbi:unnamed protein product [Soboliphyme baturini]|uniref:Ion_trans domain-containing protein n=1 Tax=Soboliphyme baturini TaxID=241478 RepID=A0A183J6E2_9BILA|nr:unnamed protein product [Soboliphyme baturini]
MRKPFFALLWSIITLMYIVVFVLSAMLVVSGCSKADGLKKMWKFIE